jgi:hypothetical protein
MVLAIRDDEFVRMKMAVTDGDEKDALQIVKEFVRRLEQQKAPGTQIPSGLIQRVSSP